MCQIIHATFPEKLSAEPLLLFVTLTRIYFLGDEDKKGKDFRDPFQ